MKFEGPSRRVLLMLALYGVLVACSGEETTLTTMTSTVTAAEPVRKAPDFGGVQYEYREQESTGETTASAINQALSLVIEQVNGKTVHSASISISYGNRGAIQIDDGERVEYDLSGAAFADAVASETHGAVRSFQLLSDEELSDGRHRVRIGAEVAHYAASEDTKRPRIVVLPPNAAGSAYVVGDRKIDAAELAGALHDALSSRLMATDRFAVMDREFDQAMQAELSIIQSGQAANTELARLGQTLTADLLVIAEVEDFAYRRSERKMRTSDKTIVSYAGGASINLTVINPVTSQTVFKQNFSEQWEATAPTTLGVNVDSERLKRSMLEKLTERAIAAFVGTAFPISVVSLTGDRVILSQGKDAVRGGARYRAVLLGEELIDPQTGQSLGRREETIGVITIASVSEQMSEGILGEGTGLGEVPFHPGLIEIREELPPVIATEKPVEKEHAASARPATSTKRTASTPAKPKAEAIIPPPDEDEDW